MREQRSPSAQLCQGGPSVMSRMRTARMLSVIAIAACRGGAQAPVDGTSIDIPDRQPDAPLVTGVCVEDPAGVGIEPAGFTEAIVHDATGFPICRMTLGDTTAHVAVPAG